MQSRKLTAVLVWFSNENCYKMLQVALSCIAYRRLIFKEKTTVPKTLGQEKLSLLFMKIAGVRTYSVFLGMCMLSLAMNAKLPPDADD